MLRLATGVACGALIGVERRWRARMAGLRATVHLRCERPTGSHIRAQLLQALTTCGLEDDPPPMEHQAAA
ncbi:hypothetical protein [Streptomyces scopuliridis]|uniref:Uncharacterized protein n=1 Tax=Streptomyces scopuliridis RB72 TaxID=1440053 RepID=A0A2T7T8W7_9ACTN|nr:hypothetical protein [Streptomyces scopuliridis]PVE11506.1 hypothetical protein Y717_02835 [Streptomyces scopuliridis RB72]